MDKISFRYDLLNRHGIKIGELDGVTSGKISYGDFRVIKRSAQFILKESREIDLLRDTIKLYFVSNGVETPLGVFHLQGAERRVQDGVCTQEISGLDKLIILERDKFTSRFLVASGETYVGAVKRIMHTSGLVSIEIPDNDVQVEQDKEIAVGTNKRLLCNELLREIGYNSLWADVHGVMRSEPYIEPSRRDVGHVYSSRGGGVVLPDFRESLDLDGRHNVFVRASLAEGGEKRVAVYENSDPLSPISTANKMRSVDYDEIEGFSQDALDSLVRRMGVESGTIYSHLRFGTALSPSHGGGDILLCDFPELWETPRRFTETAWEMELAAGGVMWHDGRRVVRV